MTSPRLFLVGEESTAARALEAVVGRGLEVVGVASEGRAVLGRSALDIAGDLELATFAPRDVASPSFGDRLRAAGVDLLLNVHSLVILPGEVVSAPTIGSYNLHPGPLPRYGGLNTPSWGIYEDAQTFAVTLHWMDEGVDTGPVAYEAKVPITAADTGLSLSARCASEGIALIDALLERALVDPTTIPRTPQPAGERRLFGRNPPFPETMPWDLEARQIERLVRASNFLPFPFPLGSTHGHRRRHDARALQRRAHGCGRRRSRRDPDHTPGRRACGGSCGRVARTSTGCRRRQGRGRPRRHAVASDGLAEPRDGGRRFAGPRGRRVNYRAFERADRPAVIALLERVFDGWGGDDSVAYWEWKFDRNPHGPARIWVAEEDDVIAGCYIYNPVHAIGGGSTIRAAQSVDAAVDMSFQGRGYLHGPRATRTRRGPARGVRADRALPSEGALNGQVRIGFVPHVPIAKLYRWLPYAPRMRDTQGLAFRPLDTFDARFGALAEPPDDGLFRVARDPGYLSWRYLDHPGRTYDIVVCEQGDELCGYSVLAVDKSRGLIAPEYVIDFQVRLGARAESTAAALLQYSLRRLRMSGARCAVAWARPPCVEHEELRRQGLRPRQLHLGSRPQTTPRALHRPRSPALRRRRGEAVGRGARRPTVVAGTGRCGLHVSPYAWAATSVEALVRFEPSEAACARCIHRRGR